MARVTKPRKHGNCWEFSYYDASGKRRWKSASTFKEAQQELRRLQSEADAERSGARRIRDPDRTFDDLVELWKDVKHRKRSLRDDLGRIRNHLLPEFTGRKLVEITTSRVAALERHVSSKVSTGTVRQVLSLLRSMLNLAVEHDWLLSAPKVRLPKAPELDYEWLKSEDDMRKLLEAARATDYPGLVEFYATALYTGMRAGELCGLRWEDVDLERRLITVQRSFEVPTKLGAIRRVPILDPLLPLLEDWRERCVSDELVFPNKRGKMHVSSARVMRQTFLRCVEDAGLPRITFHALRHTFASHWMLKGGDIYRLQRILGHTTIAMTQRYAHLAPAAFEQDYSRFGDFVPTSSGGEATA